MMNLSEIMQEKLCKVARNQRSWPLMGWPLFTETLSEFQHQIVDSVVSQNSAWRFVMSDSRLVNNDVQ